MEPRLSSSKKWTSIPGDYVNQVQSVLSETFAMHTEIKEWIAEGRIYSDELLLRVGFLEKGRLAQVNFEMSIQYKAQKDNVFELLNLAVDVGASLIEEYFAAQSDQDFPKIWQPFKIENREVYIQYSGVNSRLEAEADRLLGIDSSQLVTDGEEDDSDELLRQIKNKIGLDDGDEPTKDSQKRKKPRPQ